MGLYLIGEPLELCESGFRVLNLLKKPGQEKMRGRVIGWFFFGHRNSVSVRAPDLSSGPEESSFAVHSEHYRVLSGWICSVRAALSRAVRRGPIKFSREVARVSRGRGRPYGS